jgi:hypothetical protein
MYPCIRGDWGLVVKLQLIVSRTTKYFAAITEALVKPDAGCHTRVVESIIS